MPPRTPYTPYTAFASKQNPFEASFDTQPHLLDDSDDPLAALYNTILRFVDRDMKRIMELADKVGVKTSSKVLSTSSFLRPLKMSHITTVSRKHTPGHQLFP